MFLFDTMFVDVVFILFPLSIYVVYSAYVNNLDLKEKDIYFETALFSSLYLQIRAALLSDQLHPMVLVNIPLLLAYLKKKNVLALVSSIILVVFYYTTLHFALLYLILEYSIYFVIFTILRKKQLKPITTINIFSFNKALFMSIQLIFVKYTEYGIIHNLIYMFCLMSLFILITYLVLHYFDKGQKIISLNKTLKDLQKEKDLRATLSKINHEIKNPLAVCKGYLDMFNYDDPKKSKKYVGIIKNEIDRTLTIINDYSDYTKMTIDKEEVDLMMLIEDITLSLKDLFKKYKAEVTVQKIDDEIYVEVDYNRMKQVILNILKNSLEAADKTRKLKINISLIFNKKAVSIRIKDNGVGIDKEHLKKVGEVFYTTKQNGTGFGVCLSKEIVALHGGSLTYNSKKDKGTTAYIKLPYKKPKY